MTEVSPEEVTERRNTSGDSSSAPVPIKPVSSSSFQRQEIMVDLCNIQLGSSMKVPQQSPIAGLVDVELPSIGFLLTLVSFSSSSERSDYSGDDNVD